MRINANIGDEIWYFKLLNDDYYGRPINGVSNLKHAKIIKTYEESTYHNLILSHYELDNGEKITDIGDQIYLSENEAIIHYNDCVNHQIKICDENINKLNEYRKELENKLISERAL